MHTQIDFSDEEAAQKQKNFKKMGDSGGTTSKVRTNRPKYIQTKNFKSIDKDSQSKIRHEGNR